jgi:carboxymethylenebutenolidase
MAEPVEVKSQWVEYASRGAVARAYVSVPAGNGPWPGVVMIHENPGVTEHRMDVTRRLAASGYATITPDLFSRIGGKPPSGASDVERRQKIDIALPDDQVFDDLMNGYQFLENRPDTIADRIALYGICMGGGKGFYTICRTDVFRCFVDFYGPIIVKAEVTPDGKERSYLPGAHAASCPMQYHVGDKDVVCPPEHVALLRDELKRHQKQAEFFVYPGAEHAFHDDSARRYAPESAQLAWTRALQFFDSHLKS